MLAYHTGTIIVKCILKETMRSFEFHSNEVQLQLQTDNAHNKQHASFFSMSLLSSAAFTELLTRL